MEEYLKSALDIVKAQASARPMTEDEILSMVNTLSKGFLALGGEPMAATDSAEAAPATDPKKALKEKSITCLECGKSFKIISTKHLVGHGLTAKEYRVKYGYKKDQPLCAKALARERRAKMKDMKLWELRKKKSTEAESK